MTDFLASPRISELAREQSVRGLVTRLALEKAAAAEAGERQVIEQALQELLARFSADGGGDA